MATTARKARTKQASRGKTQKGGQQIFWIVMVGVVLLFGIAIVMTRSGTESTVADIDQFRSVSVEGRPLPGYSPGVDDPAVGMPTPTFKAETFTGSPVNMAADGRPKVVMFLAHWCPHCQADVRSLQAWLDNGGSTGGVDLYAVSTWADSAKPNFPPSDWLERENWTITTAVDDRENTLAASYGLSGTPMYVFIDAENIVRMRYSGKLPIDQFEEALVSLR